MVKRARISEAGANKKQKIEKQSRLIEALDLAAIQTVKNKNKNPYIDYVKSHSIFMHTSIKPNIFKQQQHIAIDYLNQNFPAIRILVSKTKSGFGHQASSLEVARQLRYRGYQGALEIFWQDAHDSHFQYILNSFENDMRAYALPFTVVTNHSQPFVLGMTGGHDAVQTAALEANCQTLLVLQPYQWTEKACIVDSVKTEEKSIRHDQQIIPKSLNSKFLGHHYQNQQHFFPLEKFINKELTKSKAHYKSAFLNRYVQFAKNKLIDLQLIYSILRLNDPQRFMLNLVNGLLCARKQSADLNKNIMLLIVDDFSEQEKTIMMKELGSLVNFIDLIKSKNNVENNSPITLCFVGKLPEPLFVMLLQLSTLPPVFEGANATNRMLSLAPFKKNISYISVHDAVTEFLPSFSEIDDRVQKRCHELTKVLNADEFHFKRFAAGRVQFIADYILDCINPDSLLNHYFRGIARQMLLPNHDIVMNGVIRLVEYLKTREKENLKQDRSINPPR